MMDGPFSRSFRRCLWPCGGFDAEASSVDLDARAPDTRIRYCVGKNRLECGPTHQLDFLLMLC